LAYYRHGYGTVTLNFPMRSFRCLSGRWFWLRETGFRWAVAIGYAAVSGYILLVER